MSGQEPELRIDILKAQITRLKDMRIGPADCGMGILSADKWMRVRGEINMQLAIIRHVEITKAEAEIEVLERILGLTPKEEGDFEL